MKSTRGRNRAQHPSGRLRAGLAALPAALLALLALLALTACGGGSSGGQGLASATGTPGPAVTTTPSAVAASTGPAPTTARPSRPATVPVATPTTVAAEPIGNPRPGEGLDFGFLTEVTRASSGTVTITFNRATFIEDANAPDGYRISDTSGRLRTFTVQPNAAITGSLQLLDDQSGPPKDTRLTLKEFVANGQRDVRAGERPAIWLRHTGGTSGPVTALAEQYLP